VRRQKSPALDLTLNIPTRHDLPRRRNLPAREAIIDFIYKTRLYLLARSHGTWSAAARVAHLSPESLKSNVKQLGDRLARLQGLPDGTLLAWENGRLTPTPLGTWLEANGGPVVTAHDAVFSQEPVAGLTPSAWSRSVERPAGAAPPTTAHNVELQAHPEGQPRYATT
jgi:hypothetical protein